MPRDDDDRIDVEFPFFRVNVRGGDTRVHFGGDDDGEEVIDMESNDSGEYRSVRRRVWRRLRFVRHAFVFVALNSVFFLLDWSTGGDFWVQWVALIWGIFLGWEFISNFVAPNVWGREAEERMVQRELRRRRGA